MKRAHGSLPTAAIAGASSRISRLPVAWLRMCSSSPIVTPCAASPKTSTGPRALEQPRELRPERVAEEPQPLDRLVVADAEPERAARAFVERRVRARAAALVGDHPDRHRRRADAGHRADVVVFVAGFERDLAALEQPLGLVAVGRPALEHRGREQRAPLRVADAARTRSAARSAAAARRAGPARRRPPARPSARAAPSPRSGRSRRRCPRRCGRRARPHRSVSSSSARGSPPAGGRQSTSTTGAPCARSASANVDSPTLIVPTPCRTSLTAKPLVQCPQCPSSSSSPMRSGRRPDCRASATSG